MNISQETREGAGKLMDAMTDALPETIGGAEMLTAATLLFVGACRMVGVPVGSSPVVLAKVILALKEDPEAEATPAPEEEHSEEPAWARGVAAGTAH